jgi:prepilin-type processing-associated H-X9-DG protein
MADEINCVNHLKEIGLAIRIYTDDNGDTLPQLNKWCDAVLSNNLNPSTIVLTNLTAALLHCPATPRKQKCGYAINENFRAVTNTTQVPIDTVLLFESDLGWNAVSGLLNAVAHHGGLTHVCFLDGSVQMMKFDELDKLRWNPITNSPVDLPDKVAK